ncbi:MAG: hypothetical protein ACRERV_02605 [Methylococcales bacterium]
MVAKLDAVVGKDFLDLERILGQGLWQEPGSRLPAFIIVQFRVHKARSPVDCDKPVPGVPLPVDLCRVDVQVARSIVFEGLAVRFFSSGGSQSLRRLTA